MTKSTQRASIIFNSELTDDNLIYSVIGADNRES